jgi:hypothetical protein
MAGSSVIVFTIGYEVTGLHDLSLWGCILKESDISFS